MSSHPGDCHAFVGLNDFTVPQQSIAAWPYPVGPTPVSPVPNAGPTQMKTNGKKMKERCVKGTWFHSSNSLRPTSLWMASSCKVTLDLCLWFVLCCKLYAWEVLRGNVAICSGVAYFFWRLSHVNLSWKQMEGIFEPF